MELSGLTVESTRVALQEKQFTARALVEALFAKIERDETHAWLTLAEERAHAKAAELDRLADQARPRRVEPCVRDRDVPQHLHQHRVPPLADRDSTESDRDWYRSAVVRPVHDRRALARAEQ